MDPNRSAPSKRLREKKERKTEMHVRKGHCFRGSLATISKCGRAQKKRGKQLVEKDNEPKRLKSVLSYVSRSVLSKN